MGDAYGESNRVADLNVGGDPYTISNYRNKGFDIKIRWKSLTNNGKDATIEIIVVGDDVPTKSPTDAPTTIKCVNEEGTVYVKKRNNGKPDKLQTCNWINKAKTVTKALERCRKRWDGEYVFNRCKKL